MGILKMIDDRKTHIGIAAFAIVGLLRSFDIVVPELVDVAIVAWTGVAIRHTAKKIQKAAAPG